MLCKSFACCFFFFFPTPWLASWAFCASFLSFFFSWAIAFVPVPVCTGAEKPGAAADLVFPTTPAPMARKGEAAQRAKVESTKRIEEMRYRYCVDAQISLYHRLSTRLSPPQTP